MSSGKYTFRRCVAQGEVRGAGVVGLGGEGGGGEVGELQISNDKFSPDRKYVLKSKHEYLQVNVL